MAARPKTRRRQSVMRRVLRWRLRFEDRCSARRVAMLSSRRCVGAAGGDAFVPSSASTSSQGRRCPPAPPSPSSARASGRATHRRRLAARQLRGPYRRPVLGALRARRHLQIRGDARRQPHGQPVHRADALDAAVPVRRPAGGALEFLHDLERLGRGQEKAQQYARQHPRPPEATRSPRAGSCASDDGSSRVRACRALAEDVGAGWATAAAAAGLWRRRHYGRTATPPRRQALVHRCSLPCSATGLPRRHQGRLWNRLRSAVHRDGAGHRGAAPRWRRRRRRSLSTSAPTCSIHCTRASYAEDVRAYLRSSAPRARGRVSMARPTRRSSPPSSARCVPRAIRDWNARRPTKAVGRDDVAFSTSGRSRSRWRTRGRSMGRTLPTR